MSPLRNYLHINNMSYDNIMVALDDENTDITLLRRICLYLLRIVFPCRRNTTAEDRYID